jgi:hypothetical protein
MFYPECPERLWSPPVLLFVGYRGCFSGVKRYEREGDHSAPSTAYIKNERRYTITPPIRFQGVDGENFTFYTLIVSSCFN